MSTLCINTHCALVPINIVCFTSEEKIAKRRLTFFGHVCRLPETTPVKIALREELLRPSEKTRGRPKTTYLQVIKTQLKERHFQTLEDTMIEAKDRVKWRSVVQDQSFLVNNGQQ